MTSGATATVYQPKSQNTHPSNGKRTPIRTPNYSPVLHTIRLRRHTKVRQLHRPILVSEDIRTLDVAVDHTLVVEVHQPLEHL